MGGEAAARRERVEDVEQRLGFLAEEGPDGGARRAYTSSRANCRVGQLHKAVLVSDDISQTPLLFRK